MLFLKSIVTNVCSLLCIFLNHICNMENVLLQYSTGCLLAILIVSLVVMNYSAYKRITDNTSTPFLFYLALLFFSAAVPLCILGITLFWIYHQLVTFILFIRHGSKFGGLLHGIDAIHTTESAIKAPVHFLFVIQYQVDGSKNFFEFVKQEFYKMYLRKLSKMPKVFASLERAFGYCFLLKNEIVFEDCFMQLKTIKSITDEIEKADLMKLIGEYSNYPLPKNFKGMWDVLVGTQAVKWKENFDSEGRKFYPIVLRFNHILADAFSLQEAIREIFADKRNDAFDMVNNRISNSNNELKLTLDKTNSEMKNYGGVAASLTNFCVARMNETKYFIQILYAVCLFPAEFLVQVWFKRSDTNILYGPHLSNRNIFSLNVEESPHYIKIIKDIKKKIDGSTFTDVVLTGITASLNEYFEQKSVKSPDYTFGMVAADLRTANTFNTATSRSKLNRTEICRNEAVVLIPKLHINTNYEGADTSLISRLKMIQKEFALIRNSGAYETNYLLMRIAGTVYVRPFLEFILNIMNRSSVGVSNLPGISKITVSGGYPLEDMAFWVASRDRLGVGFSILTYDGRLKMGLTVDKVLISEQSEVDGILNGVYRNLDLLHQQVNCNTT